MNSLRPVFQIALSQSSFLPIHLCTYSPPSTTARHDNTPKGPTSPND